MTTPSNGPTAFPSGDNSQGFPRLDAKRKDPTLDAMLGKLVASNDNGFGARNSPNRPLRAPDQALLQKISDITTGNVTDAHSLFQLLPDTELAMQILVSSILSPKDMVTTELNFSVDHGQFNSELAGAMLEVVRNYFENVYKISELLPKQLEDSLFKTGAYPMLVLPESSIDEAINGAGRVALETLRTDLDMTTYQPYHLGILGQAPATAAEKRNGDVLGLEGLATTISQYKQKISAYNPILPHMGLENKKVDLHLSVVDNPNVLKLPILQEKMRQDRMQDVLGLRKLSIGVNRGSLRNDGKLSMESDQPQDIASLYRRRRYKAMPITAMMPSSQLKKKSVGHPLVMHLPTECVIPVHVPSNPEEHLGYFILLDQQGNPLIRAEKQDYYTDMANGMRQNQDMVSGLINRTQTATTGMGLGNSMYHPRQEEIEQLERTYSDLVEGELMARLRNGVYGDNVQVGKPQEIYRIMLARSLAKMQTQILYVPAEMMTYIAFDYNQYGVGISLLQSSKILGGIRAMMLFANTMAAIKNSVGRTKLNITLDPQDPDPSATVEFMMHEFAKTKSSGYPLGASSPVDLVSFLQNAGVEVAVSGNAAYPETKLEVEDAQSNRAKPDTELEKSLRDRHIMSMGMSPETVDAGANAEFATTIVQNNLLLSKRVMVYQKQYVPFLVEFIQKYTINSGYLLDELRRVINERQEALSEEQKATKKAADDAKAKAEGKEGGAEGEAAETEEAPATEAMSDENDSPGTEQLVMEFIQALRVSLPAPDTATLDKQMVAFDAYAEALDKVLKAYLDPSFLEASSMGEMAGFIEPTIAAVRAHYLRQWLRNNNVLSELDDLTTSTEDGPAMDLLKTQESHIEGLGKSILSYMEALAKARQKINEQVAAVQADTGGEPMGEPAEAGGADLGADADLGGDGGDDLANMDLDTSLDEAAGEDTPAADEDKADDTKPEETKDDEPPAEDEVKEETPKAEAPADDDSASLADGVDVEEEESKDDKSDDSASLADGPAVESRQEPKTIGMRIFPRPNV